MAGSSGPKSASNLSFGALQDLLKLYSLARFAVCVYDVFYANKIRDKFVSQKPFIVFPFTHNTVTRSTHQSPIFVWADYSECGIAGDTQLRNDDDENFGSVGGEEAKPGAWPWQAAIYVKGNFRCGGALIKGNWVITVAHCFFYDGAVKPKDVIVRMGKSIRDIRYRYFKNKRDVAMITKR